jgi:hypothetical protein
MEPMKKLVLLVIVALLAWYGWKRLPTLLEKRPSHEAVVQNSTGMGLTRIRLSVDGQTFVKEELPDGANVVFPFRVGKDASFQLTWQWADKVGETSWSGGMVPAGPMVQRHTMTIDADGGVVYQATTK